MSELNMILNPKTNRYVKRDSQTGKRLLKELATPPPIKLPEPIIQEVKPIIPEPKSTIPEVQSTIPESTIQKAMINTGVDIVEKNASKFIGLSEKETDALFKKLLLQRLSIKDKKSKKSTKHRFKVQSSSESESDSEF
jgi:hypothetical protein